VLDNVVQSRSPARMASSESFSPENRGIACVLGGEVCVCVCVCMWGGVLGVVCCGLFDLVVAEVVSCEVFACLRVCLLFVLLHDVFSLHMMLHAWGERCSFAVVWAPDDFAGWWAISTAGHQQHS
jgi:hypothetical protein